MDHHVNTLDLTAFKETVTQQNLAVRGIRVFQNNLLTASWQPVTLARQNIYSGTKSFTSAACGFAVQEGLFSLDDRVLDHFPAEAPENPSSQLQNMRLIHLITMSMGFDSPMLMGAQRPLMKEKDWVKSVLNAKTVHEQCRPISSGYSDPEKDRRFPCRLSDAAAV